MRLIFSLWAGLAVTLAPVPAEADETVRPYAGQSQLRQGIDRLLLEPWQRFDTARYLHIANDGYDEAHSVFPPLYPMLMRGGGWLLRLGVEGTPYQRTRSQMIAGILISNLATIAVFSLLHQLAQQKIGADHATRAVVYLALFPTSFFLFASYTESLFLLLAMGAILLAERGDLGRAGILAFVATLTRTTGVGLVVPLAYYFWQHRQRSGIQQLVGVGLAGLAMVIFLVGRAWLGMPAINQVYAHYWHQTTSLPGRDLWTATQIMFTGEGVRAGEFTLYFDFFITFLLIGMTILVFRRFGAGYGLYCVVMLLFILLPRSDLKPIFSFSRYALTFFPIFLLWGDAGKNSWINRLILYPSFVLLLYFSGQFFIWGWVA